MNHYCAKHALDVASATGAYLFNVLPELLKLPAPEQHKRLTEIIETALLAYFDTREEWLPKPSKN